MTDARPTPEQFQLDQLRAEVAHLAAENVGHAVHAPEAWLWFISDRASATALPAFAAAL